VTGENSRPRRLSQGVAARESRALVRVREFPAGGERRDLSSPSSRGRRRSRRDEFWYSFLHGLRGWQNIAYNWYPAHQMVLAFQFLKRQIPVRFKIRKIRRPGSRN
jgi:hypothetical protein